MPTPNLVHPADITVEPIDKGETSFDRRAREPRRGTARKTAITFPAQPSGMDPMPEALPTGLLQRAQGYLLARRVDLEVYGYQPEIGDHYTKIGWQDVDVYLLHIGDCATYPDQQGATMFRLYYGDREVG